MVMCEMSLDRLEQLLIGATCELLSALALDDTSLPLVDRVHFVWSPACRACLAAPRRGSLVVTPIQRSGTLLKPRWRYVSGTFPRPGFPCQR